MNHNRPLKRGTRRATELDPLFLIAKAALGWVRYFAGRYETALKQLRLSRVHALRGDRGKAQSLLTDLEADATYQPAYEIGKAWLALGENDKAMDWLERALEQRSHSMVFIHVDPQLDALRNESRFQALADRAHPSP